VKRSGEDIFLSFLKVVAHLQSKVSTSEKDSVKVLEGVMWDCPYCGHEMQGKEEQRLHVQNVCSERPSFDFSCPYCGLEFESKAGWGWGMISNFATGSLFIIVIKFDLKIV